MDWNGQHYYSLNSFFKNKFGTKVAKISIDAGFTCPNRDGKISNKGCIYCSEKGSGDFAESRNLSISEQLEKGKLQTSQKWKDSKYIAYFQSFTNTYGNIQDLKSKYYEALSVPDVVGISIATRPDCIDNEIIELLNDINKKTYLMVELGFQTSDENTAKLINRGYQNKVFEDCIKKLNENNIDVVVHIILGLPNETHRQMMDTIKYVSKFNIQGVKIHLLHVLKNTPLFDLYSNNPFPLPSREEYVDLVCEALTYISPNVVIHRLTGDGAKDLLVAPLWSLDKRSTLNSVAKKLKSGNVFQGDNFNP